MTVSDRPDSSVTTLHLDDGRIASRVLVVEPDQHTCALHRQLLEQIGCEVVGAFDGRDALVKALTCQPALVLTEMELPFFDGHALCELLQRDSTTRTVPILVVTTERGRAQFGRARAAGADAFLAKPATLDALFTHIRHLLAPSCKSHSAGDRESDYRHGPPPVRSNHPRPLRPASRQSPVKGTPPVRNRHAARATAQPGLSLMRSPTPVPTKSHRWGQHSLPRTMGRVRVSDPRIVRSIRVSTTHA
jgi:two-component system cell cycle response regulator DivK